ncbi:ABC transporter ATP-binding protein [Verticiella sediminum]|uniref:ABC transporter ATP-binding protein n=1 Tax=Verticiella sediminum TaxID=1247510 RepID=UPI001FE87D7D|nr:ABC transporter ATP-binding protein [Verticiella sediminum]
MRNYGKGVTVGPIDCSIRHGEFVSLLGPSGRGKTTMLRCMAGFERVDSGSITVDGQDITATPPYRRGIGLVFQNYALFPHLIVRENVGFGLKVQKAVPQAQRPGRVAEALEMVGLSHLAERYPAQLSGGQQQRVGPREIYAFPANHFVADFIGASNLLKVVTFERNGTGAIAVLNGGNRMACRASGKGTHGQHWISIRPESIKPVSGDVADGHNVFRAKVLSEVFCGDKCEVSVQLSCAHSGTALPSPVTMHLTPQARLQEGTLVGIAPDDVLLLGEAA